VRSLRARSNDARQETGSGTNRIARFYCVMRQGAHHVVAALAKLAGNPRRYLLYTQRHYRQAASDAAGATDKLPQKCK